MIEYVKTILTGQFEASLCMLNECVQKSPHEHWEGKIANDTFRQVAYHTLFFVDLYLSPGEGAFQLRDCHHRGGDERRSTAASTGLAKDETLSYLAICRQKALETLACETPESLQRESGFSWLVHLTWRVASLQHPARATSYGPTERLPAKDRRRRGAVVGRDGLAVIKSAVIGSP